MYQFHDGGRAAAGYKGNAHDCVCRSIAITTCLPYKQVYRMLAEVQAGYKGSPRSARNGIHTHRIGFKRLMRDMGFRWIPLMVGAGEVSPKLGDFRFPDGRCIASLSRHYCAVIDNVIYDTFDPRRELDGAFTRRIYGYWILED